MAKMRYLEWDAARRETVPDTVSSQMLANDLAKFTLE
jgi:hypothetical protein